MKELVWLGARLTDCFMFTVTIVWMRTKAVVVKTTQDEAKRLDSSNYELGRVADPEAIVYGLYESGQPIRKDEKN